MTPCQKLSLAVLGILALSGCSRAEAPPAADTAAAIAPPAATSAEGDRDAVRAANAAWFKAFNARDVDAITALYADDAVVYAPGMPAARGAAAIKETLGKDIGASTKAGLSNNIGTNEELGVSGDLAWESNTFTVTDTSGKAVDKGKYVTVFERRNGKWLIIRDIWNSDGPPAS